jgi:hypothetical protein
VVDDIEALALAQSVGADVGLNDGAFEPLESGGEEVVGAAAGAAVGNYQNIVGGQADGAADGLVLI